MTAQSPEDASAAHEALAILDRMVEEQPSDYFQPMSDAVRKLVQLRDRLIVKLRAAEPYDNAASHLASLNAVISSAIGAQFPIVGIKRERIEQTRDALRDWMQQDRDRS